MVEVYIGAEHRSIENSTMRFTCIQVLIYQVSRFSTQHIKNIPIKLQVALPTMHLQWFNIGIGKTV
jgi:hypothetical protein